MPIWYRHPEAEPRHSLVISSLLHTLTLDYQLRETAHTEEQSWGRYIAVPQGSGLRDVNGVGKRDVVKTNTRHCLTERRKINAVTGRHLWGN